MSSDLGPALAAKVLSADIRNVIKKVTEGGTLTTAERDLMLQLTLEPSVARQARIASLLKRWAAGGRLSPEEQAEIRETHSDFAGTTAALPLTESSADDGGTRRRITKKELDGWKEVYSTEHRQLRRYIATGEQHDDPCPLDDPTQMPAWWGRRMKQVVPPKILAAAAAAPAKESEGRDGHLLGKESMGAGESAPADLGPNEGGFALEGIEAEDGESVRQAWQIVASNFKQLSKASNEGRLDDAQLWQTRWEKSVESYRRQKKDDREWRQQSELLISRAEVEGEVFAALRSLVLMRQSMVKRVLKELQVSFPDLSAELTAAIGAKIEEVRAVEDEVFRDLGSLKSTDDLSFRLVS